MPLDSKAVIASLRQPDALQGVTPAEVAEIMDLLTVHVMLKQVESMIAQEVMHEKNNHAESGAPLH